MFELIVMFALAPLALGTAGWLLYGIVSLIEIVIKSLVVKE